MKYVLRAGAHETLVRALAKKAGRPVTAEEERNIEADRRRQAEIEGAPAACANCHGKPPAGFTCRTCGAESEAS